MFHESSYVSDLRQRLYSKNMEIHCNTQTIDNLWLGTKFEKV